MEGEEDEMDLTPMIVSYLNSRNFNRSATTLQNEKDVNITQTRKILTKNKNFLKKLDIYCTNETDIAIAAYDLIHEWVSTSLPLYKNEFSQILFPCFSHTYLDILMLDCPEVSFMSEKFLKKYFNFHKKKYSRELMILKDVKTWHYIFHTPYTRMMMSKSFNYYIKLAQSSFDLFVHYLKSDTLEHCNFDTPDEWTDDTFEHDVDGDVNMAKKSTEVEQRGIRRKKRMLFKIEQICSKHCTFDVYKGQPIFRINYVTVLLPVFLKVKEINKEKMEMDFRMSNKRKAIRISDSKDGNSSSSSSELLKNPVPSLANDKASSTTVTKANITTGVTTTTTTIHISGKKSENLESVSECVTDPSICFYTINENSELLSHLNSDCDCECECDGDGDVFMKNKNEKNCGINCMIIDCNVGIDKNEVNVNGPIVICGYEDSTIRCWNWNENKVEKKSVKYYSLHNNGSGITGISLSSQRDYLLSTSLDGTIRIWNKKIKKNLAIYRSLYFNWDVKFSKINYTFCTGCCDKTAKLYVTDRISPVRLFVGHTSDVTCVDFHPNTECIASGSIDRSILIWDIRSAKPVRVFVGHINSISNLNISKCGLYLSSSSNDHINVWDLRSSKALYKLNNHTNDVTHMEYTDSLISSAMDNTIRIWDVKEIKKQTEGEKKKNKSRLLKTFYTKSTPVYHFKKIKKGLILAVGVKSTKGNLNFL